MTPEVLRQLQERVAGLLQRYQPLLEQCRAAEASADRAALVSALEACVAACGEGWLPQGLQDLGAAVCAATPQTFACNLPTCSSLEGLTEAGCVKKCGACKVCVCVSHCLTLKLAAARAQHSVWGCMRGVLHRCDSDAACMLDQTIDPEHYISDGGCQPRHSQTSTRMHRL